MKTTGSEDAVSSPVRRSERIARARSTERPTPTPSRATAQESTSTVMNADAAPSRRQRSEEWRPLRRSLRRSAPPDNRSSSSEVNGNPPPISQANNASLTSLRAPNVRTRRSLRSNAEAELVSPSLACAEVDRSTSQADVPRRSSRSRSRAESGAIFRSPMISPAGAGPSGSCRDPDSVTRTRRSSGRATSQTGSSSTSQMTAENHRTTRSRSRNGSAQRRSELPAPPTATRRPTTRSRNASQSSSELPKSPAASGGPSGPSRSRSQMASSSASSSRPAGVSQTRSEILNSVTSRSRPKGSPRPEVSDSSAASARPTAGLASASQSSSELVTPPVSSARPSTSQSRSAIPSTTSASTRPTTSQSGSAIPSSSAASTRPTTSQSRSEVLSSSATSSRPSPSTSQAGLAASNLMARRTSGANLQLASLTTHQRLTLFMEAAGVLNSPSPSSATSSGSNQLDIPFSRALAALLSVHPSTSASTPSPTATSSTSAGPSAGTDKKIVLVPLKESGSLCSTDVSSAEVTDNAAAADTTDSSISSSLFAWSVGSNGSAEDTTHASSIDGESSSSIGVLTDPEAEAEAGEEGDEEIEEEEGEEEEDLLGDDEDDDFTTDTSFNSFSLLEDDEPGDEKYEGDDSDSGSWTDVTDDSEYKEEELMENTVDKPGDEAENDSWTDGTDSDFTGDDPEEDSGGHDERNRNALVDSDCSDDESAMESSRWTGPGRVHDKPRVPISLDVESSVTDYSEDESMEDKSEMEEPNINPNAPHAGRKVSTLRLTDQVETSDEVLSSALSNIDTLLCDRLKIRVLDGEQVLVV